MSSFAKGIWVTLAVIAILAVVVVLSALITMWAWNFGVVVIVAACGGGIAKIGFWAAFWANVALGVVRGDAARAVNRAKADKQ